MTTTVGVFFWERLHQWGIPVNNQELTQVRWGQRVQEGDPKFSASQDLREVPYHKFAQLIGLKGIYVDDPTRLGAAWEDALSANRPVVLEVRTDPNAPPLPPHITLTQAKHFASTLLRGDPNEGSAIVGTAKELLSRLLPGHKHPTKTHQ